MPAHPLARAVLVLLGLSIVLMVLRTVMAGPWALQISCAAYSAMGFLILYRSRHLWRPVRITALRKLARAMRWLRRFTKVTQTVLLLQAVGFGAAILGGVSLLLGMQWLHKIIFSVAVASLFLSGVLDLRRRLAMLFQHAWAPMIGKVTAITVGAALACLVVAMSKRLVHQQTKIDPALLSESTRMFGILLAPLVYAFAVTIVLAVYGFGQMLIMASLMMSATVIRPATEPIGVWTKLRLMSYRLRAGKRPPGHTLPSFQLFSLEEISFVSGPLSTATLMLCIAGALDFSTKMATHADSYLGDMIVFLDYRNGSQCANLESARVAYMDDGLVSVARQQGGRWIFTVESCKHLGDGR